MRLLVEEEEAHPAAGQADFARLTLPCNGVLFWYATVRDGAVVRYDPATATVTVAGP